MRRLTEQEKLQIKRLAKNKSLNNISKKLGLAKSVVYYWLVKEIGMKTIPVKINRNLKLELGEILGAFAGDGNYYFGKDYSYKIRIYLSKNEYWYAKRLSELFEVVYNRKGTIFQNKTKSMNIFQIFGKEIITDIRKYLYWKGKKTYSVRLKGMIENYDPEFLIGFCRGLFNTDGWFTKKNMGFGSTSYGLFINFLEILNLYNIEYITSSYKKESRNRFYLASIPKKYQNIVSNVFKIKKMLPTGISGN